MLLTCILGCYIRAGREPPDDGIKVTSENGAVPNSDTARRPGITAPRRTLLIAGCALAIAAGAYRVTAPPGPGLDPDSMSYLGAARSLVADGTLSIPVAPWWSDSTTQPLAHFPPGFSTVLAAPIALGVDARLAARLVESAAAGLTIAMMMLALWPAAGAWGAVLGALAVAVSPAFVQVHLSVLSEPLFLALVTLALWSFARRPNSALLHGVIAAAATMVRYAGLSVAGAAGLWALRDASVPWRTRARRAVSAVAPSLLAMAAWSLSRERSPGHAESIRAFGFYGQWGPTLRQGASTVARSLAPSLEWDPVPWPAALLALMALAALAWSATRPTVDQLPDVPGHDEQCAAQRTLLAAAGVIALSYVGIVVASRAFADPNIPFDFRLAVPLVPLAVASIAVTAARSWRVCSRPSRVAGMLALSVWGTAASRADFSLVHDALTDGSDFAAREWRESPTLAWARAQEPSRVLYSNWPCAIWFHLDRPVRDLPDATDAADAATMRNFVARVRAAHGAVVAWNEPSPDVAHTDSIVLHAGLVRVATFDDGSVFEPAPLASTVAPPLPARPPSAPPVAPPPARR